MLNLDKPLIIFDVETTGVNPDNDRIIDLAAIKILESGTQLQFFRRYNPGFPISAEVTAVHGITDEDVKDMFPFNVAAAEEIYHFFKDCDVAGYNVSFDLKFLRKALTRNSFGIFANEWKPRVIDAFKIFSMYESRSLTSAVKFYCGETHDSAHNAMGDVLATMRVLKAQITRYELAQTVDELHRLLSKPPDGFLDGEKKFRWVNDEACIAFGKFSGTPLRKLDKGYLTWMMNGDFSDEVKQLACNALIGNYPTKE